MNSVFNKIWALVIILALAGIFYLTHSFYTLVIFAAVLIFIRYVTLFSEKSEDDIPPSKEKKSGRSVSVVPLLKKIWVLMIFLSIVCIAYLFNSFVTAMHSNPDGRFPSKFDIKIGYRNAPEGTVYVDVLGKIDSSDETYTDFNVVPQNLIFRNDGAVVTDGDPLDIDENSEIARYNEDGYMSLSIHSTDVRLYDLDGDGCDRLILNWNGSGFYKKYGKYKLAYVGEHGEVIGVTKKASHSYDPNESNSVFANGDKATYSEEAELPAFYAAVITIFLTIILTVIVIIASTEEKVSWDKWVDEQVQKANNIDESGRYL
jgi:energy-coupling factor transporter transmembrane protein EcfT